MGARIQSNDDALEDGEWIYVPRKHEHECCNCHEIHTVLQRVVKHNGRTYVFENWRRNPRATAVARRKK